MAAEPSTMHYAVFSLDDGIKHIIALRTFATPDNFKKHVSAMMPNGATIHSLTRCKDQDNFITEIEQVAEAVRADPNWVPLTSVDLAEAVSREPVKDVHVPSPAN